jgi:hypothetical protein
VNSIKRIIVFLLCIGVLFWSNAHGQTEEPTERPSLISSLHIPAPIDFCGERVPIESQEVRERFEKELLLSLWDRPQVILWLKRSRRYMPTIEQMLKENGLPEDLKYVAVAESALRPHVRSRRGATGFWQFIRRNLLASTRAAIWYFKELHKIFDSWTLAVAAFNMGEDGLMTEMMEQNSKNYYALYIHIPNSLRKNDFYGP